MSEPLRLTAVADGSLPRSDFERLAEAIEPHTGAPVRWVEGTLADVTGDTGFVLLVSVRDATSALSGIDPRADLLPRLILSTGSPRDAVQALERRPCAAIVDRLSLLEWSPGQEYAVGPAGLRSVGESVGASCVPLFTGDRHCLLQSPVHDGLPHLLVDYLRAYERQALGTDS